LDNRQIVSEIIVQILGFLAVFAILKAFAWKRLLGAIDARRHKIQEEFHGIENQKKNLENLEKDYRVRLEHIEQEARTKIQEASNVGVALARDIQEKARQDSQKLIDRARVEIEQDVEKAKITMRKEVVEISSLITEKILQEKLDARDHQKLVDQFIKELERV
jgi:F-type H+-transporting ATPase subunit b